jgi:hypothetical protein
MHIATVDSGSDERITSARTLLLETILVRDR